MRVRAYGCGCIDAGMCFRTCSLTYTQRACAILPAASLVTPYFSTLSHKRHNFGGKNLLNMNFVFLFSLQLLFQTFLILRRIQRNTVISVTTFSRKVSVILVGFNQR
jgi:hypothetical protein